MVSSLVYSSRADAGVEGAQTEACEAWAAAHGPGIARVRGTDRPWPAWSRFKPILAIRWRKCGVSVITASHSQSTILLTYGHS